MTNLQCAFLCALIKCHSTGFMTEKKIYDEAQNFLDTLDIWEDEIKAEKEQPL